MCGDECPNRKEAAILRSERGYWQAMHRKALERGEEERRAERENFDRRLGEEKKRVAQLEEKIAELEAKVRLREQQLFGRKSEQTAGSEGHGAEGKQERPKPKGQKKGSKGHGRRKHPALPEVVDERELPPHERQCACCGLPFRELEKSEDSEEIEIEVKAHRRVIRRKRYLRTCRCPGQPRVVSAPCPAKLIPKGKYAVSVWVMVLLDKFQFQRPTHRLLQDLRTHGLCISQGSLTGGLARLAPLFKPLVEMIVAHQREAHHWHADETTWMVFVDVEGKVGHRWFLWMVCSADTVVFVLDESRSAEVPTDHFGEAQGIVNADRYAAYKAMAKRGRLLIAYCWAHVRRDFLAVAKSWPDHEAWAMQWIARIRTLYALNDRRVALWKQGREYAAEQTNLELEVVVMKAAWTTELAEPSLHPAARKKLESLEKHWSGLLLFVGHPWVPMDNNTAEREQRGPVVGRKNYYGSGSLWSGELTAALFSVFHTLERCGINPRPWLHAYLQACAEAGGRVPNDLASYLPWNLSEERRRLWQMPATTGAETTREPDHDAVLRPGVHRSRPGGDSPDHRGGPEPNTVGDLAAGV